MTINYYVFKSAGKGKEPKKSKKNKHSNVIKPKVEIKTKLPSMQKPVPAEETGGDDDEPVVQAELDMINSLTGIPFSDDELLFAVPVVAPYNTLANYK